MSQVSIIDIEGNNPTIPTRFNANDATFAIPVANVLEIYGATVAAGVLPVWTTASGKRITTQVQISQAIAATDALKIGLSAFDTAHFSVDGNGFVSLLGGGEAVDSLTGDDLVKVDPDVAGNINILGLSGSKTSGAVSSLTIKSPPYADQGVGTATLNSGSFVTGAVTITLPATAGLADGDLVEIVATNGVVTIQLVDSQVGHLAGDSTTADGTFVGSSTGDFLALRYQSSTNDFWATSAIGVWTLA